MDPTAPSQPSQNTAYSTSGNAADQNPSEEAQASFKENSNSGSIVDARERGDVAVPSSHGGEGVPSSLGYGSRSGAGDSTGGEPGVSNTEAEQMSAPGEGEIAAAQDNKTGFGEQDDLASNLDRKKAEQAPAREEMIERREAGVDVGAALSERSGPAVVEGR